MNYDAATGDVTIEEGDTEVIMNTLASIYSVNGNSMDGHGAICERRRSHHGAALRFDVGHAVDTGKDENGNTTVTISRRSSVRPLCIERLPAGSLLFLFPACPLEFYRLSYYHGRK